MTSVDSQHRILAQLPDNVALFLKNMREMGQKRNIPNISWNTADFFINTLSNHPVHSILEIGPANGFSTMMLGLACPEADIFSLECSRHAFEELRHNIQIFNKMTNEEWRMKNEGNFSPADFPPKITSDVNQEKIWHFSLYYGDAREILPGFIHGAEEIQCVHPESILENIPQKTFDFIFIDGAFRMTREFFDLSLPILSKKGLIIIDDAIKYRWKMDGFHEHLETQWIPYELVQTDEDDGVMVIDFWNIFRGIA